jgi:hypothetical protein
MIESSARQQRRHKCCWFDLATDLLDLNHFPLDGILDRRVSSLDGHLLPDAAHHIGLVTVEDPHPFGQVGGLPFEKDGKKRRRTLRIRSAIRKSTAHPAVVDKVCKDPFLFVVESNPGMERPDSLRIGAGLGGVAVTKMLQHAQAACIAG